MISGFKVIRFASFLAAALIASAAISQVVAQPLTTASWRAYRAGNTGIQGDYCDSLWIDPSGDPWIGGYVPGFEEGGLSKFVQAENRWINVSNVDYPEIGHPDNTGTTRVRDITANAQGTLWMGTGRGVLSFNPSVGPTSLKHYTASNSPWPGGWVTNIEIAPDGTVWASGYGTTWGGGGLMRFNPTTKTWTFLGTSRPEMLAVQPKPGGGYYLWAAPAPTSTGSAHRYNSTTGGWTVLPSTSGNPRNLAGSRSVDSAGNLWIHRVLPDNFNSVLDCRRPDGTWIGRPAAPEVVNTVHAYAPNQVVAAGGSQVWLFNGTSWQGLGDWGNTSWTYDLGVEPSGAVWACGVGGAARRNPATGLWQRHRISNNANMDYWNNDIALAPDGSVYACSNGGPGTGGIVKFDGQRWINVNQLTYGLGSDWPFPTDNAEAIFVRSNGKVVVNPMYGGTEVMDAGSWTNLGGVSTVRGYAEDSLNRLWSIGEYYNLSYHNGVSWQNVGIVGGGADVRRDPSRAGTVWAYTGYEAKRTDGVYTFSRTIDDLPELTSQSDQFSGMAVDRNGAAWLGATMMLGAGGTGGALYRLDPATGAYRTWSYEAGWPFPGKYVSPLTVTPDGRLWMVYTSTHQYFDGGLCCWDGQRVGIFPGPVDGAFRWGGLPHTQIYDCEVRTIPGGYELWLSCASRGIAVLTVGKRIPRLSVPVPSD